MISDLYFFQEGLCLLRNQGREKFQNGIENEELKNKKMKNKKRGLRRWLSYALLCAFLWELVVCADIIQ